MRGTCVPADGAQRVGSRWGRCESGGCWAADKVPGRQQMVVWTAGSAVEMDAAVWIASSLSFSRHTLGFFLFPPDDACHSTLLHPCTKQLGTGLKLCCVLNSVKYKQVQEPEQFQSFVHGPKYKPFVERKLCVNFSFSLNERDCCVLWTKIKIRDFVQ